MRPDSATPATGFLRQEHRVQEGWLDQLSQLLEEWREDPLPALRPLMLDTWPPLRAHYHVEESVVFAALRRSLPDVVAKMEQQHAYAAEVASNLQAILDNPRPTVRELQDARRLGRQFHAIAQHNIIEEERELLRLADQHLSLSEQQGLYRQLFDLRRAV